MIRASLSATNVKRINCKGGIERSGGFVIENP